MCQILFSGQWVIEMSKASASAEWRDTGGSSYTVVCSLASDGVCACAWGARRGGPESGGECGGESVLRKASRKTWCQSGVLKEK